MRHFPVKPNATDLEIKGKHICNMIRTLTACMQGKCSANLASTAILYL